MGHSRFGLLIEKRLHGAASQEENDELTRHLAACESCQRELTEEERLNRSLRANLDHVRTGLRAPDWEKLGNAVREQAGKRPRRGLVYAFAGLLAFIALSEVAQGGFRELVGMVPHLCLLAVYVELFVSRRERARRLIERNARLERSEIAGEMSAHQKKMLLWSGLIVAALVGWTAAVLLGAPVLGVADSGIRYGLGAILALWSAGFVALYVKGVLDFRRFVREARA